MSNEICTDENFTKLVDQVNAQGQAIQDLLMVYNTLATALADHANRTQETINELLSYEIAAHEEKMERKIIEVVELIASKHTAQ